MRGSTARTTVVHASRSIPQLRSMVVRSLPLLHRYPVTVCMRQYPIHLLSLHPSNPFGVADTCRARTIPPSPIYWPAMPCCRAPLRIHPAFARPPPTSDHSGWLSPLGWCSITSSLLFATQFLTSPLESKSVRYQHAITDSSRKAIAGFLPPSVPL